MECTGNLMATFSSVSGLVASICPHAGIWAGNVVEYVTPCGGVVFVQAQTGPDCQGFWLFDATSGALEAESGYCQGGSASWLCAPGFVFPTSCWNSGGFTGPEKQLCPDAGPQTSCMADDAGSFTCANGAPGPNQGDACNACIQTSACDAWCTCAADSSADDAGGYNGCLGYVNCVDSCVNGDPEAGVPPADGGLFECLGPAFCGGDGGPGGQYTDQQQVEGQNLINGLAGTCATMACGI